MISLIAAAALATISPTKRELCDASASFAGTSWDLEQAGGDATKLPKDSGALYALTLAQLAQRAHADGTERTVFVAAVRGVCLDGVFDRLLGQ